MKLVHLSDLHIGKRVNEISMIDDQDHILRQIIHIIDEEKPAAAIGLGSEAFERAMLERDRLSARVDLLRIALDDEQKKSEAFSAAGTTLVHVIRSFLAMSELKRAQELGRFCGELEMHLPELEQAVGMIH